MGCGCGLDAGEAWEPAAVVVAPGNVDQWTPATITPHCNVAITPLSLDLRIAWSDLSCAGKGVSRVVVYNAVEQGGEAEGQQSPAGECLRAEAEQPANCAVDCCTFLLFC